MSSNNALMQMEQDQPEVGTSGLEEVVIGANANADMGELDQMFKDLESAMSEASSAVEKASAAVVDVKEELAPTEKQMIEAGHAASTEELKTKAMEELDQQSAPAPDNVQAPAPVEKKTPATKRISTVGMSKSEALATTLGDKLDSLLVIDTADLELSSEAQFDKRFALLERIDKMPKKIGEKVTNMLGHIGRGNALSNYTRIALNFLVQNSEMSSKQLKDAYMTRYSEGTASSQCTQLMHLLPAMGIAIKRGNVLIPNPSSTLLPMLIALKQSGPTTGPVETPEDSEAE